MKFQVLDVLVSRRVSSRSILVECGDICGTDHSELLLSIFSSLFCAEHAINIQKTHHRIMSIEAGIGGIILKEGSLESAKAPYSSRSRRKRRRVVYC